MSNAKRNALFLLFVVSILILLLAMSLPNQILSSAQPFSLGQSQPQPAGISGVFPGGQAIIWVLRGIVALVLIFFPIYVIYSLLTSEGRQRLIADVIVIVILLLLATYLEKLSPKENTQDPQQIALAPQNSNAESNLPISVFSATPPSWLTPAIILLAAVLCVILIFVVQRFLQRATKSDFDLGELAHEAQNAIDSLSTGGDLKVTVINCYREMTRIVKQQRGIERATTMTVREFENYLISTGLPQEAVKTLTRLFEQVRYGGALEGTQEEQVALSCLTDIVNACTLIGGQHETG